jgi:hypothetical protein
MAVHDNDRRTARDYMHNARTRYDDTSSGTRWFGILAGLAIVAFILYMLFAAANPRDTGEAVRQTPQNPTTTTVPQTTSPPSNTTTTAPTTK